MVSEEYDLSVLPPATVGEALNARRPSATPSPRPRSRPAITVGPRRAASRDRVTWVRCHDQRVLQRRQPGRTGDAEEER